MRPSAVALPLTSDYAWHKIITCIVIIAIAAINRTGGVVVNLRQLSVLFLMALVSANSAAQTYPSKPIRMVVPNAAGGGMDFLARTVSGQVS